MTGWRRAFVFLAAVFCAFILVGPGLYAKGSSGGSGTSKPVHVKQYTKKDGTHVRAHDRSEPKSKAEKPPREKKTKATRSSTARMPAVVTAAVTTRDSNGRIKRSQAAKHAFEVETGYPHGRKGYVVDHIVPLACGGTDAPSNMQWQTVADAKAKDKVERVGCR